MGELSDTAGSDGRAPLVKEGQRIRPSCPIGRRRNARGVEKAQPALLRRQERKLPGLLPVCGVNAWLAEELLHRGPQGGVMPGSIFI